MKTVTYIGTTSSKYERETTDDWGERSHCPIFSNVNSIRLYDQRLAEARSDAGHMLATYSCQDFGEFPNRGIANARGSYEYSLLSKFIDLQ